MASALGHGLWSFLKHYIFKRGFIDGWAGFVIAFGNFEGTFYRYAKRYEETQGWQPPKSEAIDARLDSRLLSPLCPRTRASSLCRTFWDRRLRGDERVGCRCRISDSHASSPVFFVRPRVGRSPIPLALEKETEGARDAKGPDGPTGLDASRHRGLSKSDIAASPPSPKASRARCLRFAPRSRPRWTYLSGNPPLPCGLSGCLSTA